MAEITVNPLAQIASTQRTAQNSGYASQAASFNATPDQSSFAEELKARSQPTQQPNPPSRQAPSQQANAVPKQPDANGQKAANAANGQKDASQPVQQGTQANNSGAAQSTNPKNAQDTSVAVPTTAAAANPLQFLMGQMDQNGQIGPQQGIGEEKDKDKLLATDATGSDTSAQLIATPFLPANAVQQTATAAGTQGGRSLADLNATTQGKGEDPTLAALMGNARPEAGKASDKTATLSTLDSASNTQPQAQDGLAQAHSSFAAELEQARQSVASATRNDTQQASAVSIQHTIHTPVGITGWADEVGQRVTWAAQHDNGRADLVLTPAHLGRVEVSISMNGDQATATFVAASSAAREALEDSLPHLREVLSQAGIQLGQANVSTGQGGQAQADSRTGQNVFGSSQGRDSIGDVPLATTRQAFVRSGNGLVDTFA